MAPRTRTGSGQRGVAYLALLIAIAAMSAALGVTGTFWHDVRQREKEKELLFVGSQYRRAIQKYYEASGQQRYPPSLEALLLDTRSPAVRRYLRRPWRDPLTNSPEWGIVPAPQGGIMGVYSLAEGQPIKQANFPPEFDWDDGLERYADWKFIYVPMERPGRVLR